MKAVLITGASKGIGKATAHFLAERGYHVFAGVRKQADADALRSETMTPVMIDVTDPDMIAAAVATVRETTDALAGLVNNAGYGMGGPIEYVPMDMLREQFEVNFFGQVAVIQAFMPLIRAGRGRVVNISSISGKVTFPFVGPYSASKFAFEAISDAMRQELAPHGIPVILIEPGTIQTPIWERTAQVSDELREKMPEIAMQHYGERLTKLMNAMTGENGAPPELVADAIHRALTVPTPRARYGVGSDAYFVLWVLAKLPDRVRDWLIARQV